MCVCLKLKVSVKNATLESFLVQTRFCWSTQIWEEEDFVTVLQGRLKYQMQRSNLRCERTKLTKVTQKIKWSEIKVFLIKNKTNPPQKNKRKEKLCSHLWI